MPVNEEKLRQLIAENIAYYRKQSGDTQADLAEKLNYSDKSISKWERGDGTPDIFILAKIASLYDVTVQDLLREKKVPKSRSRHILIHLLSVGLVWLVMTVLFCISKIFHVLPQYAWMVFIYAIPITGIVSVVFSGLWWNRFLHNICLHYPCLLLWLLSSPSSWHERQLCPLDKIRWQLPCRHHAGREHTCNLYLLL